MISVLRQAEPPAPQEAAEDQGEFEFVMGRGQVASSMLLILVLLVVFSGGAYVIGKASSPRPVAQPPVATVAVAPGLTKPAPIPEAATKAAPAEKPAEVSSASAPSTSAPLTADLSAPLYGEQVQGKVYLQVGAVEKGLAGIWAEGLRTHGLNAFVAPGPSDKMWRVVIGPLPNPEAYQHAKEMLDQLGINTFGRKQQ